MSLSEDTIVAPATPPGVGGVSIVRVSGEQTEEIAAKLLGELPQPRQASYRPFRSSDGRTIDAGIAIYFPAPGSFTGESVLELHGHGGPIVVAMLVDTIIALGARLAAPGEFSRRAFLNDKLDLAQAEAIVDLINAGTAQAARAAFRSLSGEFSRSVDSLSQQLINLRLHVEAAIDFPEEEIDFLADEQLLAKLEHCKAAFLRLRDSAAQGRLLKDGIEVVIVGRPNAGKSSLMNRLSGEDTAIVTDIAGTTRDVLRVSVDIDGLAVELVDTAGLRDSPDRIEEEGMRRARAAMENADAVLLIEDASSDDRSPLVEALPEGIPLTVVRNKIDLTDEPAGLVDDATLNLSAKTGDGLDALRQCIRELAGYKDQGEGALTARRRHIAALDRALAHFNAGYAALRESAAGELLAEELRLSHEALGEITGAFSSDDLLGRIFSEFCIGK